MNRKKALAYAQTLFYNGYWKAIHGDEIQDRKLAFRMADLAYNLGPLRATILLQRALNQQGAYVIAKGYFGADTLFYVNVYSYEKTTVLLKSQARGFYSRLAVQYPDMRTWKGVWLSRLSEAEETGVPMPDIIVNILSYPHELPTLVDKESSALLF
jgi:lysozyme family protein